MLLGNYLIPNASAQTHSDNKLIVPIGGNAWVNNNAQINEKGLVNWSSAQTICTAYVRVSQAGSVKLSILVNALNGTNKIKITLFNKSVELTVSGNVEKEYFVGEWTVNEATYLAIQIQGISKTGANFGIVSGLGLSGTAVNGNASFVRNNEGKNFYWGRRGPSVHLNFDTKGVKNIEWFYTELTVPKNNDVISSYYMANGFGEGYFGMQVNSPTERKILFSVWSPFKTDNPKAIPENQKIILLKKGENVTIGEFGNEGSGGQSYLLYNWQAGKTYRFLLQGYPTDGNFTVYTAYFFAPEEGEWRLIASFKRPKTSTYLTGLYSFLENFNPEQGNQTRMAYYGNQWIADTEGNWTELDKIYFTGDINANNNLRKDYAGGLNNNQFYLKNCGFFSNFVPLNKNFTRPLLGKAPEIDFDNLPE
jgi:hypothetical protein